MIGDLHVHTSRSDGSYSPREAVFMARERGLGYIGIVDHDTTEGLEEAMALGLKLGVAVARGVEISAYDYKRKRKAHILGYRFATPAAHIMALCDPILKARDERTREQVATLAAAGYPITIDEVARAAKGAATLYKQHVMSVLLQKGLADRYYGSEYRKLFGQGGICSGDIAYADAFDALRAIHADGGLAVLAHPGQLDSWELLDELLLAGLDGIELYHESHALEDHEKVLARASSWPGLVLTGGSDDHGVLGSVNAMGDIRAPFGALETLRIAPALPYRFVQALVREAGQALRAAAAEAVTVETKGGDRRDLVTRYDSLVQDFLVSGISARLPKHVFLAEEGSDSPEPNQINERTGSLEPVRVTEPTGSVWVIDPIDGTTNFACAGRDFAISVALYESGQPRLGLVYDVMADEMYAAAPGSGAYLNGSPLAGRAGRPGPAGRAASVEEAIVDLSMDSCRILRGLFSAEPEALALAGRGHRALGCASLAICRIARGSLDLYVSAKLSAWDHAAADIVLAEAGGASTTKPLPDEPAGPRSKRFYAAGGCAEVLSGALSILFRPSPYEGGFADGYPGDTQSHEVLQRPARTQ